jgi:hypothetical protein
MPDPAAWSRIGDPTQRLRTALADLYRFYRSAEPMLTNIQRDRAALPNDIRERNDATDAGYRDLLLQAFTVRGGHRKRLRAVLGHAVAFGTWRSLCLDQRLSDREAVQAMTALVQATVEPGYPTARQRQPTLHTQLHLLKHAQRLPRQLITVAPYPSIGAACWPSLAAAGARI